MHVTRDMIDIAREATLFDCVKPVPCIRARIFKNIKQNLEGSQIAGI